MNINLMAPVNPLGYGVAGYNILKSLFMAGHTVSFFPIGKPEWDGDPNAAHIFNETIKNSRLFDFNAPSVKIWHQHDMAVFPGKGKRVGFPIFELNRFNELELHNLRGLDHILVCSEWAKRVIQDNGINTPVSVVPLGVDEEIFHINKTEKESRPYWLKNKVVFMNVGKWEVRKGHPELLEAFNKAFDAKDNVELWMMNDNPFIGAENEMWKQKYICSPLGDKIKIKPRYPSQHELRALFNQIDFGVFPSHAEGWNLEILEMMACGAQIIATDYSGHTEFLNESNALLIRPNGMELANDNKWFNGQGEWCKFSIDDLVDALRFAYKSKIGQVQVNSLSGFNTVKKFGWKNSVAKLAEAISG